MAKKQSTATNVLEKSYCNFSYLSTKYIVMHCLLAYAIIIISVLSVIWIIQSIKIIELIFSHNPPIRYFLQLSLYIIPYTLFIITPIALMSTLLYVTRKLWFDNELIMLQSLGVTKMQITSSFLVFTLLVCILHYLISFYIMPLGYRKFCVLEKEVESQYATLFIEESSFNKLSGLTIYVGYKIGKNKFSNIFVYDSRNKQNSIVMTAEHGELIVVKTSNSIKLVMYNGSYQEENKKTKHNSILFFKNYNVEISLDLLIGIKKDRMLEANEYYITEMLWLDKNLSINQKQRNKIITYGHQRIIYPLINITITMIIVAIILHGYKNHRNSNIFLFAFTVSVGILLINLILQNMSLKNIIFTYISYIIIVLSGLYGLYDIIKYSKKSIK